MVRALIAFYGVLFLAVSWFSPTTRVWGINHLQFLPSEWTPILGAGFLLLVLLPGTILQKAAEKISLLLWPSDHRRKWMTHSLFGLIVFALFWLFRSSTLLLGDGQILVNDAAAVSADSSFAELAGFAFRTRTPLSTFLYFLAAQIGQFQLGLDIRSILQLLACATGAVYGVTLLWFLGWLTNSSQARVAGLGLLLFHGAMVLFFGYVEYYTLFFFSTFLYVALSIRSLTQSKSLWLPGIVLLLGMALHATGAVLLPSFLFLILARYGSETLTKKLRPSVVLMGVGGVFALVLAWWFLSGEYVLRGNFLPVVSLDVRNSYTFFSMEHLLDYANMLLLLGGVAFISVLALFAGRRVKLSLNDPSNLFLIVVVLFQQAFVFAANTDIGFGRDWDVMISMGMGLLILALVVVKGSAEGGTMTGTDSLRLSGALFLTVLPWIALNASGESSTRRFESLLRMDESFVGDYRTAYGYEVLAIHWRDRGNTRREREFFVKATEASDNIRFYENAIISLNSSGDTPDPLLLTRIARRFHRQVLTAGVDTSSLQFQDHLSMYYVALRMMRETGLCADAFPMYREAIHGGLPGIGYALLGIAQCTAAMGERDKAARLYKDLDTTGLDIVPKDWEYMGEVFLAAGEFSRAVRAFEQALAKGHATEATYFGLYNGFLRVGDKEKALQVSSVYLQTFPQGQFRGEIESRQLIPAQD